MKNAQPSMLIGKYLLYNTGQRTNPNTICKIFSGDDDKKAEEKVVNANQLLQVIEEAYPNSLTLDDMSR